MIDNYQWKDKYLVAKPNSQTTILNLFVEVELSYRLKLCRLESIFMITILQKYAVNGYKTYILHPMYGSY